MTFLTVCLSLFVGTTPTEGSISPRHIQQVELLRFARDFGNSNYQLVLDGWVSQDPSPSIKEIRLWWALPKEKDRRNLFGENQQKHFWVRYSPISQSKWIVDITANQKNFELSVELDETGKLTAFADVRTSSGQVVHHCRAIKGTVYAQRAIGIPVGVSDLQLTCQDERGALHTGSAIPTYNFYYQKL